MYESTQDAIWLHGIDLAQERDFDLGSLRVRPATCQVEWDGVSQALQRRVMQVLVALAQARGAVVSQSDLVVRCWRGLSVSDDAIYRCISKLRKLAADYPDAPYAIEAIPGVGYRLTSPSPVDDQVDAEPEAPTGGRFRYLPFAAAAAIALLVLSVAIIWIVRGRVSDDHRAVHVTVQPFDTLTNSDDARALARRIPNEIVNEFGDSQIMTVLAAEEAAKNAGPAPGLIVTGLVRDDAPSVSVDVRVEDGTTHAALWSMEFKRDRREASDLPMEVAARVADVVNMSIFARTANPPLTDDSALSALLQANEMIRDTHGGDWAQMIDRAQSVVARHPEFAFGHDVLAVAYWVASYDIDVPDRAQPMKEAARREANLTLRLDPEDAGAYAVLMGLEPPYHYRSQEATLLRGIKLGRHPKQPLGALYSYEATLLSDVGRLHEALSFQLTAHALDEWGPPKTAQLARVYANMGNLPAARAWIQKGVQLWPNHSGIGRVQQYIVGFYEQPSDALPIINRLDTQRAIDERQGAVWRSFIEARSAHSPRLMASATRDIREAADQKKISRETEVMMMAGLGETEQAYDAVNGALDRHELLEPWSLFAPVTRPMREDPRFIGLAARLGLIKYWRETRKWPDFCTDRTRRSECSPQLLAAIKSN
jgi:DNA-binding winged helix-turn-helix (wHTH) protein/TolB-like protein